MSTLASRVARRATLALLTLTLTGAAGCALFLPRGPSSEDIERAYAAGDREQLQTWCTEGSTDDPRRTARQNSERRSASVPACNHVGDLDRAAQQGAFADNLTCDNAAEAYAAYESSEPYPGERPLQDAFLQAGRTLASCERFDVLFSELLAREVRPAVHDPRLSQNYRLLTTLASEGVDVGAAIASFSAGNDFSYSGAGHAVDAMVTFMMEQDQKHGCESYASAMGSSQTKVLERFMDYFAFAECRGAAPAVANLFQLEIPALRTQACEALGHMAGSQERRLMTRIAREDTAAVQQGLTTVYPVRDACRQALIVLDQR